MPRLSAESRIVEWFENAPLGEAQIVFNIVKGRLKTKQDGATTGVPKKTGARRKRTAKASAPHVQPDVDEEKL